MPDREALIGPEEPDPVAIINAGGGSPFLILGDHAGNAIPGKLGTLGLSDADRVRHIAWDIGVQGLGEKMAAELDATFIAQRYSRLVIDCNRAPDSVEAMPSRSDDTPVPGNVGKTEDERARRIAAIHTPYHTAISCEIERRREARQHTILLALHSFTPRMQGADRPWQAGVLHWQGETRFAQALLSALCRIDGLTIGDNEPYRMDATDYTVPFHCFARRIPYAEIEVRQDLLGDAKGECEWTRLLAAAMTMAGSQM